MFVGVRYSNTGTDLTDHFRAGPPERVPAPLKAAPLSNVDRESARAVAERFVDGAVLRQQLDDSWPITTRTLRQGLTRKQWRTGNIPVTPFPATAVLEIKYRVDWSGVNRIFLKIAIVPKPTSAVGGQAFDMGLERTGRAQDHRWLVDYWVPSGISAQTPARRAAVAAAARQPPKSQLPAGWVYAPIGLLVALVLGLPLALGARGWLRSRRALRKYRRHSA